MKRCSVLVLLLFFITSYAHAQSDCPTLVTAALSTASSSCQTIGRNQVCYGHIQMAVTPKDDSPQFTFQQVGDITDIGNIQKLDLSAMDILSEAWGIALMQLQANLPDTLPGQNVTIILFGDVEFGTAEAHANTIDMMATASVNVRLRPRTDENNIIQSLAEGQFVSATGRLTDGSWVRIRLDDTLSGWVSADYLRSESDLDNLPIIMPGEEDPAPAQGFYFRSGIADNKCVEAPESGMLIQTPRGVGKVTLQINGVDISLSSTAFIQTSPDAMRVALLAGQGALAANQAQATVPTGTFSEITLDSSGQTAVSSPSGSQDLNLSRVNSLPLSLLPEPVPSPGLYRPYLIDSACTGLQDGGPTLRSGETVRFVVGCCGAETLEIQQEREREAGPPWMKLDGASLDLYVTGIFFAEPVGWYTNDGRSDWVATPGTHTISGAWGNIPPSTCTFEVSE